MSANEAMIALREQVRARLDFSVALSDEELMRTAERVVLEWSNQHTLTASEKVDYVRRLFHSFRGLDILQPLMEDPEVNEIMINNHKEIFVERAGEISRLAASFESRERLEDLIQSIVAGVNRIVNESTPIVDARLKDGSRVHVVLPPVALKGPCMTIRKFPEQPMTMEQLVAKGTLTEAAAMFLKTLVESKYNIFISGGTGTGKTTFLNALSQFIPRGERIVTIEDSAELQLATIPNLVSLETRNANTEGKGEVTIRDLIRASLRMRPNRIVIGEVRGGEALDMLQALNTGHEGSISTGHGNSVKDMLARLETMVVGAAELPLPVIRGQMASAIDIMLHLARLRDGSRKVVEISEITGIESGEISHRPLFVHREGGSVSAAATLIRTDHRLQRTAKLDMAGKGVEGIGTES
ncbi:ATPase, T2SS/T4P/T4SS family [Paenibacillus sp. J5C_2022]|uniref:CpaF family protein n=1 Tax=Paenibacillus sp. J5C2022 TaxID=2977129 RepID=UPI0021D29B4E|nr:ATPase, T2SS/T4P/T4SS family [Paenibacillus sp. J5C2022]MCU6710914.1 ATPase, T2SS/T4P/T4SS family [Paenibacillus sp. J5C2022]